MAFSHVFDAMVFDGTAPAETYVAGPGLPTIALTHSTVTLPHACPVPSTAPAAR
jgi:hypothetical protein